MLNPQWISSRLLCGSEGEMQGLSEGAQTDVAFGQTQPRMLTLSLSRR